jgi:hypothetical protein
MLFSGTDLWPLLLLVVGCGSVVTVVLSLLIATVPGVVLGHDQQGDRCVASEADGDRADYAVPGLR